MKTVTKEVYIADDGKEFSDLEKAQSYCAALENEVEIDQFCASLADTTERAKSRMRNDILKFLAFRKANEPEEVKEEIVKEKGK